MFLVAQSCPTLCDPMGYSPPGSFVHGDSPGKNTGMGCHAFLQGIFPTQGSNLGLPHCRWILYCLSHQQSPGILEYVAYAFSRGTSQAWELNRGLLHFRWIVYQLRYQGSLKLVSLLRQNSWVSESVTTVCPQMSLLLPTGQAAPGSSV